MIGSSFPARPQLSHFDKSKEIPNSVYADSDIALQANANPVPIRIWVQPKNLK
jgi:hypothetical protein